MDTEHTIAGVGFRHGRHRKITIARVHNGFTVEAVFARAVSSTEETNPWVDNSTSREYVFYTSEEVLSFVKGYLDAAPDDLKV